MDGNGTHDDLPELGKLESVNARGVWSHEAYDFTPWLLANADVVGEALGMDLDLSTAEHPVGSFSLDLIGVDRATGESVIIENQLTPTDHSHLGQLLTYAGGTNAVNVVWIATRFREEHRSALDWLNSRTDESTRFFGVEIGVVRIGSSLPAPLLTVVAQPNDWGKTVKAKAASEGQSVRQALYHQFWTWFLDQLVGRHIGWTRARKAQSQNWLTMPSGTAGLVFNCSFGRAGLCSEAFFQDSDATVNEARFAAAVAARESIESTYGGSLQFEQLVGSKGCRIADYRPGQIGRTEHWDDYAEWFIARQTRLRTAMAGIFQISSTAG
ncbi:DUF4268 domain-containing protein [Dactylosporangium sp. CA-139066]|uniref:DUF4268 domain-containing protein n=1 Tax=Dactylosporangium sp. CA-139066 TaxID=3239930 RepID=UPI003D91F5BE